MIKKSYSRVREESRSLAPILFPARLQTPVDLPLGHLRQEDGAVAATGDVAAHGGLIEERQEENSKAINKSRCSCNDGGKKGCSSIEGFTYLGKRWLHDGYHASRKEKSPSDGGGRHVGHSMLFEKLCAWS